MTTVVQTKKGGNSVNWSVTAGDGMVVVIICAGLSVDHVTNVTDSQGNIWVQATGAAANTGHPVLGGLYSDIWYCPSAGATGICNITIHVTGVGGVNTSFAYELQGTASFVAASGANGTGTNGLPVVFSTPSISGTDALFVMCGAQHNVFSTPTLSAGWTQGSFNLATDDGPTGYMIGSGAQSATITYPVNWNNTTDRDYVASIGAFSTDVPVTTGNIVIQKATNPSFSPQPFTFTPSYGAPFVLLDGQSNDSGPLTPGVYSVVETPVAGWVIAPSQNPSAIVVDSGLTTTVRFTNTFVNPSPPPPCAPIDGQGNLEEGVLINDLSLFIGPAVALYTVPLPPSALTAYETTNEGRKAIVVDFNQGGGVYARDLGTVFSWPLSAGVILDVWQPSILPMPEGTYGRATDWIDAGSPGDKFIQGIQIEADSFGNPKNFQLQSSDDMSLHPLNEMPATFNGQSIKSFSCQPFVAHSVRVVTTDGVEWRTWSEKLVFEPYPPTCMEWSTELMSYGNGWQHVRLLNIPYIASGPVTLTLFFDQWPTIVIADQLPMTASLMYPTKQKVQVPVNKSKLMGFTLSSAQPFRVFKRQLEVWVGLWGRTGPYETVTPFGGDASDGARV